MIARRFHGDRPDRLDRGDGALRRRRAAAARHPREHCRAATTKRRQLAVSRGGGAAAGAGARCARRRLLPRPVARLLADSQAADAAAGRRRPAAERRRQRISARGLSRRAQREAVKWPPSLGEAAMKYAVALLFTLVALPLHAQFGDPATVLPQMKQGGYVIVFRHGATHRDQADT